MSDTIRYVDGRRMQCKDLPDMVFLDALRDTPGVGGRPSAWRMRWDVHDTLEEHVGPVPLNLLLAKARKLEAAGKLGGCTCGCRGDWHPADECNDPFCCGREPKPSEEADSP